MRYLHLILISSYHTNICNINTFVRMNKGSWPFNLFILLYIAYIFLTPCHLKYFTMLREKNNIHIRNT